jgi:hypothetical protein
LESAGERRKAEKGEGGTWKMENGKWGKEKGKRGKGKMENWEKGKTENREFDSPIVSGSAHSGIRVSFPFSHFPLASSSRYFWMAGRSNPIINETPATAVISSISVNPRILFFIIISPFLFIFPGTVLIPGPPAFLFRR